MNEQTKKYDEDGLSLLDLFRIVKRHLLSVIIGIIAGVILGLVYSNVSKTTVYTARTSVQAFPESRDDLSISYNLLYSTFADLIESRELQKKVEEKIGKVGSYSVTAQNEMYSLYAIITVTSNNKEEAINIANAYAEVSSEMWESEEIEGLYGVANLKPADKADNESVKATSSGSLLKIILGAFVGFVGSCVYIIIRRVRGNKYDNIDDIERDLSITVLATIPLNK